jgi:L-ascorbate metabolism protein UlaG (beta-lactamase superfamily)
MATIKWHGHACFEIQTDITILLDVHDGKSLGLPVPQATPDIILLTHTHDDHGNGAHLFNLPIQTEPAHITLKNTHIKGVKAYHDDQQGARLGLNTIWTIKHENLTIAHTGDLGHALTQEQREKIGNVDILILNTGANLERAQETRRALKPQVVIPNHYHIPGIIFPYYKMNKPEDYTRNKNTVHLNKSTHSYTKETLPQIPVIHVYKPPNK